MRKINFALVLLGLLVMGLWASTLTAEARCWDEGPFWHRSTICTSDTVAERMDTSEDSDPARTDLILEEVLPGAGEYVRYLDSQAGGSISPYFTSESNIFCNIPLITKPLAFIPPISYFMAVIPPIFVKVPTFQSVSKEDLTPGIKFCYPDPWKPLPEDFKRALHGAFPDTDLDEVRYAENVDTISGQPVTIGYSIYMPGPVDVLNSRASFNAMIHELEHVEQYAAEGGVLPFALVYLSTDSVELGKMSSFSLHSIGELEAGALEGSAELSEKAWLRAYPIRGGQEYCDLSQSQIMKITAFETDETGRMINSVVENKGHGRCLDIAPEGAAAKKDGVPASLQACRNIVDLQQRWNWYESGSWFSRWYQIQNSNTGKCLELVGESVVQKECDMKSAGQQWKQIDRDGPYFRLRNKASTKCMDFFAKK